MLKQHTLISNLLLIITVSLLACSVKPLKPNAAISYKVINKDTQTGKLVKHYLNQLSNPNGHQFVVELSKEKKSKRTFSVNEKGEPASYLNELQIRLKVSKNKKILTDEYLFSSLEYPLSGLINTQQTKQMIMDLSSYVFARLNEIVSREQDDAIFTQQLKQDLNNENRKKTPSP